MKYVHPDLFDNAPADILKVNHMNVQSLNEIIGNLKNLKDGKGVQPIKLRFYIKNLINNDKNNYLLLKYDITELRDNSDEFIKLTHLKNVADGLINSLNNILDDQNFIK